MKIRCAACQSTETKTLLKIITSGRALPFPAYIPQFKEICAQCGKYKKFAPQTPELVSQFNNILNQVCLDTEGKFHQFETIKKYKALEFGNSKNMNNFGQHRSGKIAGYDDALSALGTVVQ